MHEGAVRLAVLSFHDPLGYMTTSPKTRFPERSELGSFRSAPFQCRAVLQMSTYVFVRCVFPQLCVVLVVRVAVVFFL